MLTRIDDNMSFSEENGKPRVLCNHCGHVIVEGSREYLDQLATYDGPVELAGPQVASNANVYIDTQVVFRQYCCPNCWTAFSTQVVPVDHSLSGSGV